ncbi:MAG TPA: iron-containing alcohol dehydrogenase [Anaerolineaceae bacterium]|nr:iron-containing alcohol dehydrogenase [Anaerolineaceae bacterium]HPN52948.1 iron-containing alcohol dehydrogenase [Anaerolineaceae bacterium]
MLPDYYEFSFPVKIISGMKAVNQLPGEMMAANARRPLIITDQGVAKAGLAQLVLDAFAETDLTIGGLYDQVPPESSTLLVNELAQLYRDKKCDCLVAVGGGSVIDTGKGVNILVTHGGNDVRDYRGAEMLKGPLNPMFVIPTTSGTGSEATNSAVIADPEKGVKMLFVSEFLLPRAAILDARLTLTLPPKLTAATALDALAHAMEAYLSIQKNPMSDAYTWQAVKLIGEYLPRVVRQPDDKEGRLALANASTMAGTAFSNSMVGCVHSLGHAAGAVGHIPHGVAIGIFLPIGLAFNSQRRESMVAELLLPLAGPEVYSNTPAPKRAARTVKAVRDLMDELHTLTGLPRTLSEAGVDREKAEAIAALAINDGSAMMNPVELTLDDARKLVEQAFEWQAA